MPQLDIAGDGLRSSANLGAMEAQANQWNPIRWEEWDLRA